MVKYPNQRIVTVIRNLPDRKQSKAKPFIFIYCSSVEQAARNLNGSQFKLWLYFASNQNNYKQAFSPQAVKDAYGMSLDTIRSAFNELVNKKYLVLEEDTKSKYLFYEVPNNPKGIKAVGQKKQFTGEDGVVYQFTYDQLLNEVGNREEADRLWSM